MFYYKSQQKTKLGEKSIGLLFDTTGYLYYKKINNYFFISINIFFL